MASDPSTTPTDSTTSHAEFARVAREAVGQAAIVCRAVQARLDEMRAITKDDKSPVTIADFASQAVVANVLATRLGNNVVLVGEEGSAYLREPEHEPHLKAALEAAQLAWPEATEEDLLAAIDLGDAEPTGDNTYWTLDPIDGTKGFLRGQQYAIALAWLDHGVPSVGAMACPNLPISHDAPLDAIDAHGSIYLSVAGEGTLEAPLADASADATRIIRGDVAEGEPVSACMSVEKAHSSTDDTTRVMERVGPSREPARLARQCKYAVVARGQADVYLRLPTRKGYVERIWDHAAGSLVATEAGCVVSDVSGMPLDFTHGKGLERNRGIVCAPPGVHERVIKAIKDLGLFG
ncbi:MAG: 3'(2'),5'-bisphosphate nucleotidase [Phycisphaerales bacterium]